jgi:protease secretion system outer membrane protein
MSIKLAEHTSPSASPQLPHLRLTAVLALAALSLPAQALSLMESYKAALEKDPAYQRARFDRDAANEYENIGRAALMPSVSASYNISKNDADRTTTFTNGQKQQDNPQYTSKVAVIQLRQPLFNLDAWQRYQGGKVQVNYSEARFVGDSQDLISRLTTAYLDALLAENQLQLAVAQREAYLENQVASQNLLEKGAGTKTDVLEARARYELAQAQVLEAEDTVKTKRDELGVIIGTDPGALDTLASSLPELALAPTTLAEWEALAAANNPEVRAQRYSVDYAQTEVERNRAGHYPRVDLVASHSRNTADSLFTFNQQSTVNAIGVQMSIPIYSGGSVTAQTRQAAARLSSGRADYDGALQKALVEVRKQYQLVASTRIRMSAMEQAVSSAAEAVEATRKSVAGGQRVNLDVLNAMQQLYTARRDLAEARHGYLQAYLKLHAAAGMLSGEGLDKIATCFQVRD